MKAIDTNVLVRLLLRDDPLQTAAADRFVEAGAWVSHLALAETMWVLSSIYELSAAEIARAVELLLKHRDLTIQDSEVVAAALASFRKRPVPGFSDCLLVELAHKAGHLPLGTFDRELSKVSGTHKL
ncbi:MAG: PIN domain-containing protein [Acidobacteria bacterium]|nr:PIN domain-containing protein [Acidobacteriota bacterium]